MDDSMRNRIDTYVILHRLSSLKRTGWVDYGVDDPETVMCHMYDAWLLERIFLPETHVDKGYNRDRILSMLLIHDLAEAVTGDIITPVKEGNPTYDVEEDEVMTSILASICPDGSLDAVWREWSDGETFNAHVAKDLDVMQSVVQFCLYRPDNEPLQDEGVTANWLGKRARLKTDLVRGIFDSMVPHLFSGPVTGDTD